jgi:hypothetical protein
MTISDCITNNIEKAREKSISFNQNEVQSWVSSHIISEIRTLDEKSSSLIL